MASWKHKLDGGFRVVKCPLQCLPEFDDKSNDALLFVLYFPAGADCWQVEGKVVVAKEVVVAVAAAWDWGWECPAWAWGWECPAWAWGWECLAWVWAWACTEACLQEAAVCRESLFQ